MSRSTRPAQLGGRGKNNLNDDVPSSELTATGITVTRAGRRILADVDLTARSGRILAVTGPSGSGKSTLLAVLAGLTRPDSGTVQRPTPPPERAGTGIVLQGYGLLAVLTAAENVELPLQIARVPRGQIAERAQAALDRVGLTDSATRLVEELSGGQQQRVAIARALATRPALLVADEPTAELDEHTAQLILGLFRDEATAGATVILATHDPDIAGGVDDQLHLVDGRHQTSTSPTAPATIH